MLSDSETSPDSVPSWGFFAYAQNDYDFIPNNERILNLI